MKKLRVTICTEAQDGAPCATWFKQFDLMLSAKLRSQIELTGAICPALQAETRMDTLPRVEINNQPVPDADPAKVIHSIRDRLRVYPAARKKVA